jgi:hypothetical protein
MASIDAAAALMRVGGDTARIGRAVLVRGIKEGTAVERVAAIQLAPLPDTDVVASLDDAAAADDLEVRVVALARLLDVPARRAATVPKLQAMAQGTDGAARQARLALAAASDPAAAALLEKDLFTGAPVYRERAAVALFRLGKASKMAPSLADPDPSVRMAVACSLVAEPGPT